MYCIIRGMIICILGRQPKLGLAELQAVYGPSKVHYLEEGVALVDIEPSDFQQRTFGGTIKAAALLATLATTQWGAVLEHCAGLLQKLIAPLPQGKITFGLSAYGLPVKAARLQQAGITLKKIVRANNHPARYIPNASPALNSAQVLHNHLAGASGIELIIVGHNGGVYLGQTISVQDIDDYAKRDFGRPKRDPFVGMLPPKLAQMMLNLAQPQPSNVVLDPFCGTGVVLMEAALRELAIQGTDLNPRMIEFTRQNLTWLSREYHLSPKITALETADAQTHHWVTPIDRVVSETYLGKPLSGQPQPEVLRALINDCDAITRRFLINLRPQLHTDARCCIAVPAWRQANRFMRLPVVDDLEKMGYNHISFSGVKTEELIYHRADQIVARQLLVLTPK